MDLARYEILFYKIVETKSPWPSFNQSFGKQANENEIPLLHESNGNASESGTSLEVLSLFLLIKSPPLRTLQIYRYLTMHCLFKL